MLILQQGKQKMIETIEATFDGKVFRPTKPVKLKPNTQVKIVIKMESSSKGKKASFLDTARALKLDGPPDWSKNIDEYLDGNEMNHEK